MTSPALAPLGAGTPRRARQSWVWRIQTWLFNYLPLAVLALGALFTTWLVRQTPLPQGPTEAVPLRHVPDYEMRQFELLRYLPDGRQQAWLRGERLRHYPDDDQIEVDQLELRMQDELGRTLLVTAARGQGPAKGERLVLSGAVQVRRFAVGADPGSAAPELELRTEKLTALVPERRLQSDVAVDARAPRLQLQAQGFDYQHASGLLKFRGPSRTVMQTLPRP
ncbi:LPS export ABC transporter periplasmic protein LptC [Inhella proteolytica]|uniref:LPS export ABC transporter periplasmic protein LptC n=1 Tax=Inhella proteolytica TaxID=2795029 RepID=A0A931NGN3_9BURK|nr:LPS export ABC transporter periplasmic protein LptC [Inhella proteolytica]MBH9577351.1 LPS export ABC transporter periplasmic protein LptC [Inhella proteolytica]